MSWLCKCGLINSGLNESGSCSSAFRDGKEHYQITPNEPDFIQAVVATQDLRLIGINMTEREDLFVKFYNAEKILVKDMDSVQLREHREQLSQIALEAKARLQADDDESRERNAKSKNKEWQLSDSSVQSNSDAINAPKIRKERMTKLDKMKEQLINAGIDEETVAEMMKNMERKATEKDVKAITFNRPAVEQNIVIVKTKRDDNGEVKAPFNPASLNFNK